MRRVMHGDLVAAARSLLTSPPADRPCAIGALLDRAQAADLYRRRLGRAHPRWGDGSLRAAAWRPDLPPEPPLSDRDYLECLIAVLCALRARGRQPRAQEMHLAVAGSRASRSGAISSPHSKQ